LQKIVKSESDSFATAGKTRIDSDSIPGPTSPKNTKKDSRRNKARSKVKTLSICEKKLSLSFLKLLRAKLVKDKVCESYFLTINSQNTGLFADLGKGIVADSELIL
jgi:hypothetical protein